MGVVACGAGFFIEKRTLAIEVGAGKQKLRPVTSGRRTRAGRPGARLAEKSTLVLCLFYIIHNNRVSLF
jgi:hypothetical protein